jgi:hypothetical protein
MPRPVDNARPGTSVNVLKKVRTSGGWRLCPVVREANGRLRDRVRVSGRTEIHTEGVYYLDWRQDGRRLREAIPNSAEVIERAHLKSLELEARKAGAELDLVRAEEPHRASLQPECAENGAAVMATPRNTTAERLLLSGIEAYIKERVDAVLRARLAVYCENCETISNSRPHRCGVCDSESITRVEPILNRNPDPPADAAYRLKLFLVRAVGT